MWFIAGWGRAVGGGRGVQVCPNPNSEEGNEGVRVAGWGGYIREERGQKGKIRWWWVCVRERRTECWRMMELQDTLGGLAVCKETSAAEEFGYVELRMNSEFWVSLTLSPSSPSQSLSLQWSWRFILPALLPSLFSRPASLPYFASPSPCSPHWLAWTNF